jgi:hypothetical protein
MELRADQLLGRVVVAQNGRRIGRVEEFHAHKHGDGWMISEYALGAAGLLERLGVAARSILGVAPRGYLVYWNQLTLAEEGPLRLTCRVSDLRRRSPR